MFLRLLCVYLLKHRETVTAASDGDGKQIHTGKAAVEPAEAVFETINTIL